MMLPLFRAGLTGKAATTAYATSLDLAAGRGKGADQGAVAEAVDIFAKIQQKGGITSKQLAGIGLGEKNVPAFWKDLGKQMHISAEAAEKQAKAGKIDPQIVEMLNETNEILDDMTVIEANGFTEHKTTVRSGLPAGTWRKLNYGVQPEKSRTVPVKDSMGMLETYAEVDKALADLNAYPPTAWTLRDVPCMCEHPCNCRPRCEIRDGERAVVASTWERAVAAMLAPPAPLCSVVVRGPGRWR